jgi:hypothetical protein
VNLHFVVPMFVVDVFGSGGSKIQNILSDLFVSVNGSSRVERRLLEHFALIRKFAASWAATSGAPGPRDDES